MVGIACIASHRVGRLFLLVIMLLVVSCSAESSTDTQRSSRQSTDNGRVETTEQGSVGRILPDLAAVDVTGNLEGRGFSCDGPDIFHGNVFYLCTRTSNDGTAVFDVEVDGKGPDRLINIEAIARAADVTSTLPDEAGEMLAFLSTLPYEGASPSSARSWVEDSWREPTLGNPVSRTFGPVTMTLSGNASGVTLSFDPAGLAD